MIETLRRMLPAGSGNFMLTLVAALGAAALVVMALTVLAPAQAQTRFVFANPSTYDTLDPHLVMDTGRSASRINLYDGLLRWQDNPAKLELWLAETYSISEDGSAAPPDGSVSLFSTLMKTDLSVTVSAKSSRANGARGSGSTSTLTVTLPVASLPWPSVIV